MSFPCSDGVVGDPGGKENGLPQLFHGGAGTHSGEYLFGPGLPGDGGNAPLIPVLPAVTVGLDDGIAHLAGFCFLLHVHALQAVRIVGFQIDPAGQHLTEMLLPCYLPLLHSAQRFQALIANGQLFQRLVRPLHNDLFCLGLVGFLNHHLNKFRLVETGKDHNLLPFLNIHAAADNQPGIFPQNSLFHRYGSFNQIFVMVADFQEKVNTVAFFLLCVYNAGIVYYLEWEKCLC